MTVDQSGQLGVCHCNNNNDERRSDIIRYLKNTI